MNTADFKSDLLYSEGVIDTVSDLPKILKSRIPAFESVEHATINEDRGGTDYWIHRSPPLPPLSLDVKTRREDFGKDDLALETFSVIPNIPGWTRDSNKRTDFILWFWEDSRRFLLVPFPPLCYVFSKRWQQWRAEFGARTNDSGNWHSEWVPVPVTVLFEALRAWSNGQLQPVETR